MGRLIRGVCTCGRPTRAKGRSPRGQKLWDKWCSRCFDSAFHYRKFKKDFCEMCGFMALDSCQLDVDHIDGNRNNNNIENLQTLCANCHRLKTVRNKDHLWDKNKPDLSNQEALF